MFKARFILQHKQPPHQWLGPLLEDSQALDHLSRKFLGPSYLNVVLKIYPAMEKGQRIRVRFTYRLCYI